MVISRRLRRYANRWCHSPSTPGQSVGGSGLAPAGAPLGKNWYDALQTSVTKRFSHGLTANANYTYSKTMALTSSPDPFNRNLGKNLSLYDVPHQFRLSAQYEVPRFHSGIMSNKILSNIFSGWGTGWYLNYQSAALVGLPTSSGSSPISNFLGYGPGPAQLIPGMSPWSVDWTDNSGTHHTDPLNINCHCFDVTKTQVLNPDGIYERPQRAVRGKSSLDSLLPGHALPCGERQLQPHLPHQRTCHFSSSRGVHEYLQPNAIPVSAASPTSAINLGNFATAPTTFHLRPQQGFVQRRLRYHRSGSGNHRYARRHAGWSHFVLI